MNTPNKLALLGALGVFTHSELNTLCMTMGIYQGSVEHGPPIVRGVLAESAIKAWRFDRTNYVEDAAKWDREVRSYPAGHVDARAEAAVEEFCFNFRAQLLVQIEVETRDAAGLVLAPETLRTLFRKAIEVQP